MRPESSDEPRSKAIEQLEELGLSAYAARTFVALRSIGEGTARDISDVSTVPRTRVYDAVEELRSEGLVDVQRSNPKRFWAVSAETIGRHFEREYSQRVDVLTESLGELGPSRQAEEQRGVWTVTGRDPVTERVIDLIESATDEIVFMTVGELLSPEVIEALQVASERNVSIKVAKMSESVRQVLQDEVPDAELFDSLWVWSDSPAGRLLLIDRKRTLTSVLVPEDDGQSAKAREETAIWGTGETNSLVIVLKAMFTWQLGALDDE